ncbi:MAG: ATP-binding cassette domain-containing protein [Synergistaceae bacterium]|jgi:oligopeptide/dipeptide ABC transporter ATP-binding protein|nr:ATP-binding cassette domain-containing protein [Synergistaceae bacterium]
MSLLEVTDLVQSFDLTRGFLAKLRFRGGRLVREERVVHAVNGVSFRVERGKVLSLVGESGCGKSTTAKTIIRLIDPKSGRIFYDGIDITRFSPLEMRPFRKKMQMIFQDPFASLNPRQKVVDILQEPMIFHKLATPTEVREKALSLLNRVGLRTEQADRYPHQFSGGQRQRIGIARALAVEPEFIVADEPVSALDVSIQAQILNLLMDLKDEFRFSCLFIAHDLSVVKHISDDVGVMYLGKIVEKGSKKDVFAHPAHPYTKALFASVPSISAGKMMSSKGIEGEIPSAIDLPNGCVFHDRCPSRKPVCHEEPPVEREVEVGHFVACHNV